MMQFTQVTKKRKRCNECAGCTREDCGSCDTCKDMQKFGGTGRKKECCQYRKCTALQPTTCKLTHGTSLTINNANDQFPQQTFVAQELLQNVKIQHKMLSQR